MFTLIHSLRFRLIVLLLMAVVPMFVLICYSAAKHREVAATEVKKNALGVVRAIAAEQETFIANAHQFLVTLARVPQIRGRERSACRSVLAGLLEPIYADLVVADRKGHPLCTALPAPASVARPDGRHYRQTVSTYDFSVGDLRYHPGTGRNLLDLGYPVAASPESIDAVISAALDFSWITRLTVDSHIQPGMTFSLLNRNGTILLRYPAEHDMKGKQIFSEFADGQTFFRNAENTAELQGADEIRRLYAFRRLRYPVNGQTVYAAVDIPAKVAFSNATRILTQDLVIFGLVSTLALFVAWFGTDVFVLRRIRDIASTTQRMAAGALSARTTQPYENSELGHLARAFDDLAQALEKREEEMNKASRQIQKQRHQQRALYDLNRNITSTLDLSQVLTALVNHVADLFPQCMVTVSWLDKESGNLKPLTSAPRYDDEDSYKDLAGLQSLPSFVLKQQSPVAISNIHVDPRADDREFFVHHRLYSYLGLPLRAKQENLGVLSFYAKEEHEFTPEEMSFVTALAHEAAIAIYNSRLFQQTREQARELEKSNKIKDEFLGVMSHELRTPLNIIMNWVEILTMGTYGELTPDQKTGILKINAQSGHLLSLINGILEITKIEAGTPVLHKEAVNLVAFLSDLRSDYATPSDRDVMIQWNYSQDLPTIMTDRMKLKQIVSNLVNNAIKFTDHGTVTVSARIAEEEPRLDIEIADTGLGIPADQIDCVFEKFRQLDSATTRDHPGAGLGLYVVKTFVDLFKGSISVRSNLGEGSLFTVRLPVEFGSPQYPSELPAKTATEGIPT